MSVQNSPDSRELSCSVSTPLTDPVRPLQAVYLLDGEGCIRTWNSGVEQMLGFGRDEWVRRPETLTAPPDAEESFAKEQGRATRDGFAQSHRWYVRQDGERIQVESLLTPLYDDSTTLPTGFIRSLRRADAETAAAQETLQKSEEFLRRVIESSPDCIKTLDLQGHILSMNEGGQKIMEVDDFPEICGVDWLTFWDGEKRQEVEAALQTARDGGTGRFQRFCPTWKGTPRWWDVAVVAILGPDGQPEQLLGVSRDITEQRLAVEQISESERRFSALFEGATVGITLTDLAGHFVLANDRYCQITGRTTKDLMTLSALDIIHADDLPLSASEFERLIATGDEISLDHRLVQPDGTPLWVSSSFSLIRRSVDEPLYVQVVAVDLTERKQAEEVRERLQQRERTIAAQLQDALIPASPPYLPGLSLGSYYRTALEEAGVGGDFHDVFALEKGCTALVVGDLSGKGLIAASQVATVRNMLRYAVYTERTLAEAMTTLNRVLAERDLLTGFATLFIGAYDHAQRTLTYVNCGQEPGLVWSEATHTIEELAPTGPVLGGYQEGEFTERVVSLFPGDVLTLFTDGLTEVGPTHKRFLEVEGVSDLLAHCCAANHEQTTEGLPDTGPSAVVASLINGVDPYARNGIRDDIALLIGIVDGVR